MMTGTHFRLLGDELHVLPQTPPWQQAVTAHRMLEDARLGAGNHADLEDQLLRLYESAQMLRDNLSLIGPVLLGGAFLAGLRSDATLAAAMPAALRWLATGLQFAKIDTRRVAQSVQNFQAHLQTLGVTLPTPPGFSRTGDLIGDAPDALPKAFQAGAVFAKGHDWNARSALAWRELLARLAAAALQITTTMPGFDELLCAARQVGPAAYLPLDPGEAGLHSWTRLLLAATVRSDANPSGAQVPFGIVAHALLRLGSGGADAAWIEASCQALAAAAGASAEDTDTLRRTLLDSRATLRDKPSPGTLVFLRKPIASVSDSWIRTPARALVLVMTVDEFRQALSEMQRSPSSPPSPSVLSILPSETRFYLEPAQDIGTAAETALRAEITRLWPSGLTVATPGRESVLATPEGADILTGGPF